MTRFACFLLVAFAALVAVPARAQTPPNVRTLASPAPQSQARFGNAVAEVPDVDGDGRGDLLVGAPDEHAGAVLYAGRAHLYSGATGTRLYAIDSPFPQPYASFGYAVAGVPDVDGDGRGDLLVGAPFGEDGLGQTDAGYVFVFSGATGALLYAFPSPNSQVRGYMGLAVAGVSDVDGDGRGDLLVGAPNEHVGVVANAGRAYLYSGATGALLRTLGPTAGPETTGKFGYAVAGVPDVDGDGRGDLLVGAPDETRSSGTTPRTGRAYLFSGSTGSLLHILGSLNVETDGAFGAAVAGIADVDGDGRGDLLVGAPVESIADFVVGLNAGRAYVISGATGARLRTFVSPTIQREGYFGSSVAGTGDWDADGVGDLVVGAPYQDSGAVDAGRVYVLNAVTGALIHALASPNAEAYGSFGWSVTGLDDVDGDGRRDFAVGTPDEDLGSSLGGAGRAYLYHAASAVSEGGGEVPGPPTETALDAPRPNPTADRATLGYHLAAAGQVRLVVYDVLGREIAVLVDADLAAGRHEASLDVGRLAAGLYVVRLTSGHQLRARALTVLR